MVRRRLSYRSRRRGGHLRRPGGRGRLLPLPLRAAAGAGLPLGCDRRLGRASSRAPVGAASSAPACSSSPASRRSSSCSASPRPASARPCSDHEQLLTKISAALIVAMGVLFVASLFVTRLNREWHVDALLERAGKGGPIVAGAAFAIAWTPCIGPTLGAILSAASLSGSAGRGAFLLAVYSAGLAIPFLLTALAFSRDDHRLHRRQAPLPGDRRHRRRDPDRDGHPDLDRPAHPAQRRSPELVLRNRPRLLEPSDAKGPWAAFSGSATR